MLHSSATADGQSDDNAIAIQHAWQPWMQQIYDLLFNAVVGEDPPEDGIAEPGMILTTRHDDTDIETFLLGARGAEHSDIEFYSNKSPLDDTAGLK
jgi:hypothetical protein